MSSSITLTSSGGEVYHLESGKAHVLGRHTLGIEDKSLTRQLLTVTVSEDGERALVAQVSDKQFAYLVSASGKRGELRDVGKQHALHSGDVLHLRRDVYFFTIQLASSSRPHQGEPSAPSSSSSSSSAPSSTQTVHGTPSRTGPDEDPLSAQKAAKRNAKLDSILSASPLTGMDDSAVMSDTSLLGLDLLSPPRKEPHSSVLGSSLFTSPPLSLTSGSPSLLPPPPSPSSPSSSSSSSSLLSRPPLPPPPSSFPSPQEPSGPRLVSASPIVAGYTVLSPSKKSPASSSHNQQVKAEQAAKLQAIRERVAFLKKKAEEEGEEEAKGGEQTDTRPLSSSSTTTTAAAPTVVATALHEGVPSTPTSKGKGGGKKGKGARSQASSDIKKVIGGRRQSGSPVERHQVGDGDGSIEDALPLADSPSRPPLPPSSLTKSGRPMRASAAAATRVVAQIVHLERRDDDNTESEGENAESVKRRMGRKRGRRVASSSSSEDEDGASDDDFVVSDHSSSPSTSSYASEREGYGTGEGPDDDDDDDDEYADGEEKGASGRNHNNNNNNRRKKKDNKGDERASVSESHSSSSAVVVGATHKRLSTTKKKAKEEGTTSVTATEASTQGKNARVKAEGKEESQPPAKKPRKGSQADALRALALARKKKVVDKADNGDEEEEEGENEGGEEGN